MEIFYKELLYRLTRYKRFVPYSPHPNFSFTTSSIRKTLSEMPDAIIKRGEKYD